MLNLAKEFKCPVCLFRQSTFFGDKRTKKIACTVCGAEFTAEHVDGRVVTKRPVKNGAVPAGK